MRYFILNRIYICLLFFLSTFSANAQRLYTHTSFADSISSLRSHYGLYKKIPKEYELQTLIALSHYPQLKEVPIEFVPSHLKTTMACRPKSDFIFKKKNKWKYRIFIDTRKRNNNGLLLQELPFNAQVGVIGHEIGHIIDYRERSKLGILGVGARYINKDFRSQFEKSIDKIAIQYGLGWQVYDFSYYLFIEAQVHHKYRSYKKQFYLSPSEIKKQILYNYNHYKK